MYIRICTLKPWPNSGQLDKLRQSHFCGTLCNSHALKQQNIISLFDGFLFLYIQLQQVHLLVTDVSLIDNILKFHLQAASIACK